VKQERKEQSPLPTWFPSAHHKKACGHKASALWVNSPQGFYFYAPRFPPSQGQSISVFAELAGKNEV